MNKHTAPPTIPATPTIPPTSPTPARAATSAARPPLSARLVTLAFTCTLALTLTAAPAPARGQAFDLGEPAERPAEPILSLDLEALLRHERVMPDRIETYPWVIESTPGRRLLALPLLIEPRDKATELGTSPSLSIRGGRFITWIIQPQTDAPADRAGSRAPRRSRDAQPAMTADSRRYLPRGGDADTLDYDRLEQARGRNANNLPTLPENAPLVSRRMTLQPNGQIQWQLERAIPNATLIDSEDHYVYRIRPARLRDIQPERERIDATGSTDRAEIARRRREAELEYAQQRRAFTELRSAVMALPDEFEAPRPARIWAVYELSSHQRDLTITGDSDGLPWSIPVNDLRQLRDFASQTRQQDENVHETIEQFVDLAQPGHVLTHRLIAYALSDADVIPMVNRWGPQYRLLQMLLTSDDAPTRRHILAELALVVPPTADSLALLRFGAEQADPTMQLLALRGQLQADPADTEQRQQMIRSAYELLADPEGPDPGQVLSELIKAIGDHAAAIADAAANVSFERLPTDRRGDAIDYVITAAGEHALAAAWLNQQLLGSASPDIVRHTLERIVTADPGAPWVRQSARAGLRTLFGPPDEDAAVRVLGLNRRVPIDSARHTLFRSLNSGNEQIRELAWQALRNFRFTGSESSDRSQRDAEPVESATPRYEALVDAALSRPRTPAQVVPFLRRQPHGREAATAMWRLLIAADDDAATQASQALLGSGWPMSDALRSLSPAERDMAARRMYESLTGVSPRVTGLLRRDAGGRDSVVTWFGDQVAEGTLPELRRWVSPFRGESDLLGLAGASDQGISAGAVAALVYAAGGDEIAVNELVERFRQMTGAERSELEEAWATARRDIYARRLAQAAGPYRLVAVVSEPSRNNTRAGADDASAAPAAPLRITLGVVDLVAEGRKIRLSNDIVSLATAEGRLAIRIEDVSELRSFQHEALDELSLDGVSDALNLLPRDDESWVGSIRLPDDRRFELRMEPVE